MFKNGGNEQSGPHYTPDGDGDLSSRIAGIGLLPAQVGRKKMKGKGGSGFGYSEPEPEVDPVSHFPCAKLTGRTSSTGISIRSREPQRSWRSLIFD